MSKSCVIVRGKKRISTTPQEMGFVVLLIIIPFTCGLHVDAVVV